MTTIWASVSYNFNQLVYQMKYLPGNIYSNNIVCAISDIFVTIICGFLAKGVGLNISYLIMSSISFAGGLSLIIKSDPSSVGVMIMILLAKAGMTGTYALVYTGTAQMFPAILAGTAFGFCSTIAKFLSIVSPMTAEANPPIPLYIFITLSALIFVSALFL